MAFLDRFRLPFFNAETRPKLVSGLVLESENEAVTMNALPEPTNWPRPAETLAESPGITLPNWLTDEDTLRDEGVLYGLSMARPDEKLVLIRAYFEQTTVALVQEIEDFNVQIGDYNLLIAQQESRIETLRARLDALLAEPPAEPQLIRTVVGLGLAVAMIVGSFQLIDTLLQPAFPQNHWVAVGVFLAGLAGGGGRPAERGSVLRRAVEWGGLPLMASLFVLAESVRFQPLLPAIAAFGFVLMLFLLAGKWLPAYLTRLRVDWIGITQNHRRRREQRNKPIVWEAEIVACEQEISALRMKKWQLQPALSRAETARAQQHAHRDRLLKIFDSEFQLARSQRDVLVIGH